MREQEIKEQAMNLTMQSETDVTACDRCKSSLERGWCERWGGTTKKGMRRAVVARLGQSANWLVFNWG